MYTTDCTLHVLVRQSVLDNLVVKSSDETLFTNLKMQPCQTALSCPSKAEFTNATTTTTAKVDTEEFSLQTITFEAILIGRAKIIFKTRDQDQEEEFKVIIVLAKRMIDFVFDLYVWSMGVVVAIIMGMLIDLEMLKIIIKKPVAVAIGICCQYGFMPLLAFSFARFVELPPAEALAIFLYGCSPGGTGSNKWAILFDADLNLSAVLTFVANILSLVVMPAWLYTLGTVFMVESEIHLPVLRILANIMITVGPMSMGFCISQVWPKAGVFMKKIAKPLTITTLVIFLAVLLGLKNYLFFMMRREHFLGAPLVPWTGYIIGGSVAWLFRLEKAQIKTVAIETGIQNVGVAFLIIIINFPAPERDFAVLPLVAVAFLTNIPLYIILGLRSLWKCFRANNNKDKNNDKNKKDTNKSEMQVVPTTEEEQ